jgi:hypothetical protein
VLAHIVPPALEQSGARQRIEVLLHGLEQARQVPVDDLRLQSQGRRGHDDLPAGAVDVFGRGHEVGQGFARARPGLHEQVDSIVDRRGDGLGHLLLTFAGVDPPMAPTADSRRSSTAFTRR